MVIIVGTVAAAPGLPDSFYGSVYLNGNPAPVGTVILAKINGETRGEITTTVAGLYGDSGNFNPKLNVAATEAEAAAGNATITFFVGGIQAFQTVPFKSGGGAKLDLIANELAFATETTVPPISSSGSSSVSNSGGGGYSGGGPVSSVSGPGTSTTSGSVQGTEGIPIPATSSRSSIYYNIDAPQTPPATTVMVTTSATPSPVVTTVPTTKKAGMGLLSTVFLATSITAVLCILGRFQYFRKRS